MSNKAQEIGTFTFVPDPPHEKSGPFGMPGQLPDNSVVPDSGPDRVDPGTTETAIKTPEKPKASDQT